jgi:hypothetical protein
VYEGLRGWRLADVALAEALSMVTEAPSAPPGMLLQVHFFFLMQFFSDLFFLFVAVGRGGLWVVVWGCGGGGWVVGERTM